jgi:hypothetical protein
MRGPYGTYGGEKSGYRVFVGKMRERDNLENLSVDGRIMLNIFSKSRMERSRLH